MDALAALITLLSAGLTTALCVAPVRHLATRLGWIDRPRADRHHDRPVALMGGASVLLGTAVGLGAWLLSIEPAGAPGAIPNRCVPAILLGAAALFGLGLLDDRRALAPLPKAVMQALILALVLLVWGPDGRLKDPLLLAAAGLAGMVVLNAWNYLDHIDGLFSSVCAVGAVVLALGWSISVADARWLGLLWGLAGASLGFLLWNLPPARIFLGDGGSLPLGFLGIAVGWIMLDKGDPAGFPAILAAHAVPIADLVLVTSVRLLGGRNPFIGSLEHSGHRLNERFGATVAILAPAGAVAVFGAAAVVIGPLSPGPTTIAIGLGLLALCAAVAQTPAPGGDRSAGKRRGDPRSSRGRDRRGV